MLIRLAREDDAAAMAHVVVDSYLAAHRDQIPAEAWAKRKQEWTYAESERGWRRTLSEIAAEAHPSECIYVAEAGDGQLVGVVLGGVAGADAPPGTGEVYVLYVRTDQQGRGVGRALAQAVAAQLAQLGMTSLQIGCLAANAPGRRFYEKIGGTVIGERMFDEEGFLVPEVIYGWPDISALAAGAAEREQERT